MHMLVTIARIAAGRSFGIAGGAFEDQSIQL